jgi:hypothetical protein
MEFRSSGNVNPFTMPTDEEVFILRDEEKRQKALERERMKYKRVHEKTTWSARIGSAKLNTMDDLDGSEGRSEARSAHADVQMPVVEKRVKDNMTKYIMKKRKMGLARMSLATKRQEIKKLDEEAERAEKRITQMEEQLRETQGKFRAFLQHSEMEQVEAFKRAENETKAKQEKIQEIKKLSAQISQIETDKKKNEDQLTECLKFKTFLDLLAAPQWFAETLLTIRKEDARQAIAVQLEQHYDEVAVEGATEAEEAERQQVMVQELDRKCDEVNLELAAEIEAMTDVDVKAALDDAHPDRVPMYFQDPDQILQKFIEIEEGNLFLITTCQEYEEEIEDIASKYKQEQSEMVTLAEDKRQQMEIISKKIQAEQVKMKTLQERIDAATDDGRGKGPGGAAAAELKEAGGMKKGEEKRELTQEELKVRIEERVKAIYKTLGLGEDANINTLVMLTQIEVKLEDMRLQITNTVDFKFVADVMKERDKDRRQAARQVLLNFHRDVREKRSALALSRSQAPVKKRVGKPVMWRSRPLDHKKQEATTVEAVGNEDDEFFM